MPATMPADFNFEPKVWADHVDAYFRKKLRIRKYMLCKSVIYNSKFFLIL